MKSGGWWRGYEGVGEGVFTERFTRLEPVEVNCSPLVLHEVFLRRVLSLNFQYSLLKILLYANRLADKSRRTVSPFVVLCSCSSFLNVTSMLWSLLARNVAAIHSCFVFVTRNMFLLLGLHVKWDVPWHIWARWCSDRENRWEREHCVTVQGWDGQLQSISRYNRRVISIGLESIAGSFSASLVLDRTPLFGILRVRVEAARF
jgi:hypothetical protein